MPICPPPCAIVALFAAARTPRLTRIGKTQAHRSHHDAVLHTRRGPRTTPRAPPARCAGPCGPSPRHGAALLPRPGPLPLARGLGPDLRGDALPPAPAHLGLSRWAARARRDAAGA